MSVRRCDVLGTLLPGFVGEELPEWLDLLLREGLGGVCLFGSNVATDAQVAALTSAVRAANPDAIIAIDEEGGDVTRVHHETGAPYPGNALLGRLGATGGSAELTAATARSIGWHLRSLGVNLAFAPVVDINSNSDNPVIGVRSFGADPTQVATHGTAWVRALQATGVGATAKHFPGHGDTSLDSHLALPVVDRTLAELRERELIPFEAVIEDGVDAVMTSHILVPRLDPDNPATMSGAVLRQILREELGFDGLIVSDALDMKGASAKIGIPAAAVRSLAAGVDLLCLGTDSSAAQLDAIIGAVTDAVETGELSAERVADAASRTRRLAVQLADRARRAPVPAPLPAPDLDLGVIAGGFDLSEHADAWIAAAGGEYDVVRIENSHTIAVGRTPWGPFAAGADAAAIVTPNHADEPYAAPGFVAVVGRDLHRRPYARSYIETMRARLGDRLLVVDMGWPAEDRAFADVATFGATRLDGAALNHLLGGNR